MNSPQHWITVAIASHRGRVRDHNEDAVGLDGWTLSGDKPTAMSLSLPADRPHIIAVCDGLGGHRGGDTASGVAAQRVTAPLVRTQALEDDLIVRIQAVSEEINDISDADPAVHGLGTTLAGVYVESGGVATVFNVGDSPVYRLESGFLATLTVDHRAPHTNTLTQALGAGRRTVIEPDFYPCNLWDSPLVLCSDGVTDFVADAVIESILIAPETWLIPERLVAAALDGGGGDNITVAVVAGHRPEVRSHG